MGAPSWHPERTPHNPSRLLWCHRDATKHSVLAMPQPRPFLEDYLASEGGDAMNFKMGARCYAREAKRMNAEWGTRPLLLRRRGRRRRLWVEGGGTRELLWRPDRRRHAMWSPQKKKKKTGSRPAGEQTDRGIENNCRYSALIMD
jgi:hypothetical protein